MVPPEGLAGDGQPLWPWGEGSVGGDSGYDARLHRDWAASPETLPAFATKLPSFLGRSRPVKQREKRLRGVRLWLQKLEVYWRVCCLAVGRTSAEGLRMAVTLITMTSLAIFLLTLLRRALYYNPSGHHGEYALQTQTIRPFSHDKLAVVVQLHVPLAAGTSIRRVLQRWCRETGRILVDTWEEDFLSWDLEQQRRVDVLSGHFGYGVHLQQRYQIDASRQVQYFTFLREPVARVMSQWRYMSRGEHLEKYSVGIRRRKFFSWWYQQVGLGTSLKHGNFGPKTLAQQRDCGGAVVDRGLSTACTPVWLSASNPMTQQMCCWSTNHLLLQVKNPRCPQTLETLDCAKVNLRKFAFVGLVERMEESVALMKCSIGMVYQEKEHQTSLPKDNPTIPIDSEPGVWQAGPAEAKAIGKANHLDIALYEFAQQLFQQQLRTASSCVKRHLGSR